MPELLPALGPSCPSVVVGLLCVCLGVGVIVGVCIYIYLVMQFACVLSCFSHIQLFASLWTVACQVLLSMGFSRQEYWSGLPFPSPGDLPFPGFELKSLMSLALADWFLPMQVASNTSWEVHLGKN